MFGLSKSYDDEYLELYEYFTQDWKMKAEYAKAFLNAHKKNIGKMFSQGKQRMSMLENSSGPEARLLRIANLRALLAYAALVFISPYALSAPNVQVYRNDQLGFEVTYPTSWEVNKLSNGPAFALKNRDDSKLGVFSVSVANLKFDDQQLWNTQIIDKGMSLVEQAERRFGEANLRSAGETKLSGHRAYRTELRYVLKNLNIELPIISVQVTCIHNQQVYLINFESPEFSYEDNNKIFQSLVYSFNFRN